MKQSVHVIASVGPGTVVRMPPRASMCRVRPIPKRPSDPCKVIAISGPWYRKCASLIFPRQDAVGAASAGGSTRRPSRRRGGGLGRIFTEASITARPFFERQGFRVVREQTVSRQGVSMINFVMEKDLPG